MKSIVIFYSRSGNTKFVAEEIANYLNADLQPLIDKKNRQGLLAWFIAGYDAVKKKTTAIEEFDFNPANYNLIFLGCPNWAGELSPALRTFLNKFDLSDRKVVLFCTQDSSGAEKVFNSLRVMTKGADVIDEKYFNKVLKNKETVRQEIRDWLGKFKS